jgi:hypothetical protein
VRLGVEFLLVDRLRAGGRVARRPAQPGLAVPRVQVVGDHHAVGLAVHLRPGRQAQRGRALAPPPARRLALHVEVVPCALLLEGVVRVEPLDELGDDGHGHPLPGF